MQCNVANAVCSHAAKIPDQPMTAAWRPCLSHVATKRAPCRGPSGGNSVLEGKTYIIPFFIFFVFIIFFFRIIIIFSFDIFA
jgi:hypothetical protein